MKEVIDCLNNSLQEHKYNFGSQCIALIQKLVEDSCLNIALIQQIYAPNLKIDYRQLPDIIKRTIDEPNNFVYQERKIFYDYSFMSNEIKVKINTQHIIVTPDEDSMFIQFKLEENLNSFSQFLRSSEYITIENYLDFEAFKDFELNAEDYEQKSKSKRLNVNVSAWNKLFDRLLLRYFNDYAYDKQCSGSKIARFSKQIVRNWKLCIEYDKNIVSKSKRSRFFEFPHLKISLIKTDDDGYMNHTSDSVLSLGVLGNPFFYYPAITPTAYLGYLESKYHRKPYNEIVDGKKILCDYVATINEIATIENDGKIITVKFRQSESQLLKEYVCYYIWLLSQTSRCYLNYIEASVESAIALYNRQV